MYKALKLAMAAAVCAAAVCAAAGCGRDDRSKQKVREYSVYCPDGAPALALARLMSGETDFVERVSYKIVSSEEISSSVTYNDESKNADM